MAARPVIARFLDKVEITESCWLWTATTDHRYGLFHLFGRMHKAHRVAYELFVGPIPEGTELDHLCRVLLCVNPDHLEPVSHRVNVLRGNGKAAVRARQTHCLRGHEFTKENTRIEATGSRRCLLCERSRSGR